LWPSSLSSGAFKCSEITVSGTAKEVFKARDRWMKLDERVENELRDVEGGVNWT
jgi:hypothetical protein